MIELTLKIEPSEISEDLQSIKIQDYAQILKNLKPQIIVMIENAIRNLDDFEEDPMTSYVEEKYFGNE